MSVSQGEKPVTDQTDLVTMRKAFQRKFPDATKEACAECALRLHNRMVMRGAEVLKNN